MAIKYSSQKKNCSKKYLSPKQLLQLQLRFKPVYLDHFNGHCIPHSHFKVETLKLKH